MKNVLVLFRFNTGMLHKDVFQIPYYIAKSYNATLTFVTPAQKHNVDLPSKFLNANFVKIGLNVDFLNNLGMKNWYCNSLFFIYLLFFARNYDCLVLFHHVKRTWINVFIYKLLNRNGKVYVKLDMNYLSIPIQDVRSKFKVKDKILQSFFNFYFKKVNVFSVETLHAYNNLLKSENYRFAIPKDKLLLVPNGFDEDLLRTKNYKVKKYEAKDNIMISVARFGAYEKNTEMLLNALLKLNWKNNWKFYFVGDFENSFSQKRDLFMNEHPILQENVFWTGYISEREKLWDFYNRSKVFVLTSRLEGFAIAQVEASRFNNYMVSTDVGGFMDLTCNGCYGIEIPQEGAKELATALQNIIDGSIDINLDDKPKYWQSWGECANIIVDSNLL